MLQDRLDEQRQRSAQRIPEHLREIMHRATEQLRQSGQAERALGVGDPVPSFALPDPEGETVRSEELLARGPLVLSFYRGRW